MNYFESIFDICYLVFVITLSTMILHRGIQTKNKATSIFGLMGLLLGIGDSFHLIPRIIGHLTTGLQDYQMALGIGKLITGITMTIFYFLLLKYFEETTQEKSKTVNISIISLILIRFALLVLPGNDWLNNGNDLTYGIIRNIPFLIIGIIIVVLFFQKGKQTEFRYFQSMGIWIIVSFVCYMIVIIGSGFIPALGAFMMPKTVAYLLIIWIGYRKLYTK